MGKSARLKGLKQVASVMPVIMRNTHEVHYVKGAELLEQGHFDIEGEKINPEGMYVQRMPVMIAINHQRNMKKIFRQFGPAGINAYIQQVNQKSNEPAS